MIGRMLDYGNGHYKYLIKVPSDAESIIEQYKAEGFKVLGMDEDESLHLYRDVNLEELKKLCFMADAFLAEGKVYVQPWGYHKFKYFVDFRTGRQEFSQDEVMQNGDKYRQRKKQGNHQ